MAAKYTAACRTSSSATALAIGPIRSSSFRAALLKYFIWRTRYSAGRPAISADSGCPCPDMRWQEPHAFLAALPSAVTIRGAGPCSSGNQSGGLALLPTLGASYTLVLPGTWTGPAASTLGGCTLSGMLYAQDGRPLGTDVGFCAAVAKASNGARSRILIQWLINLGKHTPGRQTSALVKLF